jgi:hypothetical protein
MPKQSFHINRFEGGMNTDYAPEDIPDNSLLDAVGVSVSSIGRIIISGDPSFSLTSPAVVPGGGSALDTNAFQSATGLFSFKSDYSSMTDDEEASEYLVMAQGSQVNILRHGGQWNRESGGVIDNAPFDLGASDTTNISELSYYAPNGDLRVCDGLFDNINNWNNNTKWYGYTPNKVYGDGTARGTVGGFNVQDASIEGGYPKDSSGLAINAYMSDNTSAKFGGGSDVFDSSNQRNAYIPTGGRDWGILLSHIPSADSTHADLADSTWMPDIDTTYKFYASYMYDSGQEGNPTPMTMFPTLRGYADGKISSETSGDATVTSSETIQFVDRANDRNDANIDIGIANFSRTDNVVTVTCKFLDATMDISDGDGTVNHDAFSSTGEGILIGQHIAGSGIPDNSVVKSITSTTQFELGDSDGNAVTATATTSNVLNGAIGRTHSISVNDRVIIKGTDSFDGTHAVTAAPNTSTFTFTKSGSDVAGTSTEQGYFSKVGLHQAVWFAPAVKFNHDAEADTFIFGADSVAASSGGNQRIIGSRIYWSSSEDGHGTLWVMFEANFEKGLKAYGVGAINPIVTDYLPWQNSDDALDDLNVDFIENGISQNIWKHPPKYESYESLNGYSHTSKLDAKWKTAVIANGRAYIGNVKRRESSTFNVTDLASGKQDWNGHLSNSTTHATNVKKDPVFGDRILKSPVDRFDTFPEEMEVELFGGDDGDQIVKLETFADRLFVFKVKTLYILNIAKDVEILESLHKGFGLDGNSQAQSCLTSQGIAWINSSGAYHYNGERIESLTDNKIDSFWKGKVKSYGSQTAYSPFWVATNIPSIGFDTISNKLIIHKATIDSADDDLLIYDMKIKAWTFQNEALNDEKRSNFVNFDGMLIYHEKDTIRKYDDSPHTPGLSAGAVGQNLNIYTKPYDFGTPLQRKKVYRVYVTYRCHGTTNVLVKYYVNGNSSTTYNFTTVSSNPFHSDDGIELDGSVAEFDSTAGIWETAVLKPSTSGEANNIKSFGLHFFNAASAEVDKDFEINDITIIYRNKSIK